MVVLDQAVLPGGCLSDVTIVTRKHRLPLRISSRPLSIAAKVALDQFVFAPFAVGLFFSCTTLMEGKGADDVRAKLDKVCIPGASHRVYVY